MQPENFRKSKIGSIIPIDLDMLFSKHLLICKAKRWLENRRGDTPILRGVGKSAGRGSSNEKKGHIELKRAHTRLKNGILGTGTGT